MLSSSSFNVRASWPVCGPTTDPETPEELLTGSEAEQLFRRSLKVHQGPFEFDPETMVEVESCLKLKSPLGESDKSSTHCELKFDLLAQNVSVSRLVLVSQCKRIEVYGTLGVYHLTKEGTLLDDSDPDMMLFTIDVDLRRPNLSSFLVKLTGLGEACWILALHLGLDPRPASSATIPSRFNLEELNKMLQSSSAGGNNADIKLSDKARDFKQLFETFQKSPSGFALAAPAMLSSAALMPSMSSSSAPTFASLLSPQNAFNQMGDSGDKGQEPNGEVSCQSCLKELKAVEDRLLKKLDDHQKAQNEKLDKILALLESCQLNKS